MAGKNVPWTLVDLECNVWSLDLYRAYVSRFSAVIGQTCGCSWVLIHPRKSNHLRFGW